MQTNSMASLPSLLVLLLSFGLLAWTEQPTAWTITTYFEYYTKTYTGYTEGTVTYSGSESSTLVPATPTVKQPHATETITTSTYVNSALVYHSVILEPSQGPINTGYPRSTSSYEYNVVFDLTLPTDCTYTDSTTFVPASTNVTEALYLPEDLDLAGVVTPISAVTFERVSVRTWQLNPTDVPQPFLDFPESRATPRLYERCESSYYHFDGNFSRCLKYQWQPLGDTLGGGYKCSNGRFHTWRLQVWSLILAILLPWFGVFLFIGLWESFLRFQRLMRGEESRRGLPAAWGCLVPILALLLLKFRRDGFAALSRDERNSHKKQWEAMSAWKKLKLWLRYGFTYGYPPILGTPPPPRTQLPDRGVGRETGVELAPPPYTRVPTPRTSTDTPAVRTPDLTAAPQEPPRYGEREGTP